MLLRCVSLVTGQFARRDMHSRKCPPFFVRFKSGKLKLFHACLMAASEASLKARINFSRPSPGITGIDALDLASGPLKGFVVKAT